MQSGGSGYGASKVAWLAAGAALVLGLSAACSSEEGSSASVSAQRPSAKPHSNAAAVPGVRRAWTEVGSGAFTGKLPSSTFRVDEGGVHVGDEGSLATPSFSVVSIGRDSTGVLPAATPQRTESALLIDRGVAKERLEIGKAGLEQSWEFATRPAGAGPLVVRLGVADMAIQGTNGKGLRFSAADGEISYGAATWIDAAGNRTPVSTRYHAGVIELTVPAGVVDAAAYPALLDPTISTAKLLMVPERLPGGRTGGVAVGCNTSKCLVAWGQDGYLVARRVQLDGTPIDASVIGLETPVPGAGPHGLTITATPDRFLVSYTDLYTPEPGIRWLSIDAGTGAVSDAPPRVLGVPASSYPTPRIGAHTNGVQYLVIEQGAPNKYLGLRLVDGQVVAPTAGVDLGAPNSNETLGLVAGTNQFAFVQRGRLQRIAASTGALLDAAPIAFSKYGYTDYAGAPAVAFDGANYIVVWFDSNKLQASRVRASDGVVLDPDDDFNELSGARVLCTGTGSAPVVAIEGGKLYVTWMTNAGEVASSFPLAPWTPSAAACAGTVVAPLEAVTAQVGAKGLQALPYYEHLDAQGIEVKSNGVATVTNAAPINYHASVGAPVVVSNGRDFMLSATQVIADEQLRTFVLAVDGVSGKPAPSGPADVSASQYEARKFASAGNSYLIPAGGGGRRASCDGKVGPVKNWLPGESMYAFGSDGAQYFAVTEHNTINGYRIDLDGNPIDATAKKLIDAPYRGSLVVGGNPALAANLRTFTVLTPTDTGLAVLRMRSASGAVLAPILIDTNNKFAYPNLLVGDGTNLVFGWMQQTVGQDTEFWTARFDPTTGALSDKKVSPFEHLGSVSFDGSSYLEMWQAGDYHSYMRRLDTSFSLVDPSAGTVLPSNSEAHDSNRYGRTLLVSADWVPQDLGTRLVGYFIDNDLAAGDPDDAPVTCVPDNEGGAGGQGGAGAAAGTGGVGTGGVGGTLNGGTSNGGSATGGITGVGGDTEEAGAGNGGVASGGEPNEAGAPATGNAGEPSVSGGTAGTAGSAGNPVGGSGGNTTAGAGTAGSSAGTTTEGGRATAGGANASGTTSAGAAGEPAGSKDASGCGCRLTPTAPNRSWALALSLVALLLRRRRKA